jgi:hypothetical protein
MYPSQVRTKILHEHTALRRRLHELEVAVDAMRDRAQATRVAAIARELLTAVVAHTQLEDAILAPALRDIDAWGTIRAEVLLEHHEQQRAQLRALIESYAIDDDCERLARVTLEWVRDVRTDMIHEESNVLSAALLRDDPISVAMESG